jgi:hypothetical protein
MVNEIPGIVGGIVWVSSALLAVLVVLAAAAQPGGRAPVRGLALGLALWAAAAVLLGAAGVYQQGPQAQVPAIGLGVALPLLLGIGALQAWPALRERLLAIPQTVLIGIQTLRLVGVVFLLALGAGALPAVFALPAGLGDVAVGLAAPLVALAWARGARTAPAWALLWNLAGIADLVLAVGIGFLSGSNPYRLIAAVPPTDAVTVLPLVLVPTFGVPLFLLLHGLSLAKLRRAHSATCAKAMPRGLAA